MRLEIASNQLWNVVAALLPFVVSLARADSVESDKDKLRGYWNLIYDSRQLSGRGWRFVYLTSNALVGPQEHEYAIDPTQAPKHINLRGTNWQGAVFEHWGIYELTNDILRMCWAIPNSRGQRSRPAAFKTNQPNGGILLVLKRGDPNEGEFTYYQMETQTGTVANRVFRDEQGHIAAMIYYGGGPLYGFVPENLHVQGVDIFSIKRGSDQLRQHPDVLESCPRVLDAV